MKDTRHNARILLLQKLFEEDFHEQRKLEEGSKHFTLQNLLEADELGDYNKELYEKLGSQITENLEKIDKIIAQLAPEWPIDKIATIDLQILRLAILEGFILKVTPEKVAIDEAIELSKEFSNDQSRKFVSGVLGNLFENREKYL